MNRSGPVHPDLPIFLILDNPSKEDLLFAIKHGITNVFTLPMEREMLKQAIDRVVKCRSRLHALATSLLHRVRKAIPWQGFSSWSSPAASNGYALQLLPPSYNFLFDAKVEAGQMYDLHIHFFDNLRIHNSNGVLPKNQREEKPVTPGLFVVSSPEANPQG